MTAIAGESDNYGGFISMGDEFDRLRADNVRLRAALQKIANDEYTKDDMKYRHGEPMMLWESVARRALEQKADTE